MSRTNHPRIPGTHRAGRIARYCQSYCCEPARRSRSAVERAAIDEGLLDMEPERPLLERWDMNRLHAEAWREDAKRMDDLADEAWAWLATEESRDLGVQQELEARESDDDAYESDYMPLLTMTEAREHFGPDFEHNGFQIDSTNAPRRVYRKAPTMHDYERAEALMAAQKQRLAALMPADEKAKVTRQLPVPHAERPEPAPYDKFSGRYNEALDPISPNFDRSAW